MKREGHPHLYKEALLILAKQACFKNLRYIGRYLSEISNCFKDEDEDYAKFAVFLFAKIGTQ